MSTTELVLMRTIGIIAIVILGVSLDILGHVLLYKNEGRSIGTLNFIRKRKKKLKMVKG